ncbi:LysM peptidoglycan-binding domain-containing protein [Amycolatopsis sp. cmx-11-32]|uniref:LysM peptidoglycan-binding domain-containing protein n=1 Tax=Amycolatopsis sp. cmx-11-32 TaxID=2785796 RepID=UPI0039E34E75
MTSRAAQVIRGVLAALALLAFVAGVPSGLVALGAGPTRLIPDRWPDPAPISRWPERIWHTLRWAWLTGDLVIWLVLAVAWVGWLMITVSVAAELIRQTGHGLSRVPCGRWIAGLVAAVLIVTSTSTAAASGVPAAPVVATAPPRPQTQPLTPLRAVPYTVVHGDTLWDVAERCLGNGTRYHEVVRLNRSLLADNPDDLEPGWTLLLPADAVGLPRPVDTAAATIDVRPGDTLSGIAERELGDPDAWPELFDLNVGRAQPDGRALRHPDRLLPGWNLVLPVAVTPPPERAPEPVPPSPESRPQAPPDDERHFDDSGISLPGGVFVSLGLAALVTLAMVTVRLRRRRWYQPGSPEHADPAGLPVVRALRIAHDSATWAPDGAVPESRPAGMDVRDRAQATVRAVLPDSPDTVLGVRAGQAVALDLARKQGLGLVGSGAHAAARALIVTLLARAAGDGLDATVLIPASDARSLFGHDLPDRVPERLRLIDDLPAALDVLEAELLARGHEYNDNGPFLVVAAPAADTERRAHAVLESGSRLGLAGLFLGRWRPGGTVRVSDDGAVEATSPALSDDLSGARLFTLPAADALDLLSLLRAAGPGSDEPPREHIDAVPDAVDHNQKPVLRDEDRTAAPLRLDVLGRLHLTHTNSEPRDLIESFAPRQREILAYLAQHREGCRRETLSAALWPDAPGTRPYNSFHATLSQLRRGLRRATEDDDLDVIVSQDSHYGLDPAIVTVDLWQLRDALAASRTLSPVADAVAALDRVAALYHGDLAEGMTAEWIEGPREALRREILNAFALVIRTVRNDDPEQALALLEQARRLDAYNEAIYRDLMRMQARLGQYDGIPRTLHLLTTSLKELDQCPAQDTSRLAHALSQSDNHQRDRQAG